MKLQVSGFNLDECENVYRLMKARLNGKQICAGGEENKDSCEGDSGDSIDFKSLSMLAIFTCCHSTLYGYKNLISIAT